MAAQDSGGATFSSCDKRAGDARSSRNDNADIADAGNSGKAVAGGLGRGRRLDQPLGHERALKLRDSDLHWTVQGCRFVQQLASV